jgi:hypothetical protein
MQPADETSVKRIEVGSACRWAQNVLSGAGGSAQASPQASVSRLFGSTRVAEIADATERRAVAGEVDRARWILHAHALGDQAADRIKQSAVAVEAAIKAMERGRTSSMQAALQAQAEAKAEAEAKRKREAEKELEAAAARRGAQRRRLTITEQLEAGALFEL